MRSTWVLEVLLALALLGGACGAAPTPPAEAPATPETTPEEAALQEPAAEEEVEEVGEVPQPGENVLNVYNWSTYIAPQTIPNFEKQFEVTVNYDLFDNNEALLAKLQVGNPGYDIIVPSDYMVQIMIAEDMLLPLERSLIPNLESVHEAFRDPPFDPGMKYCVPYQWGTLGVGYNVTATGGEISSWTAMFEPKYRVAWLDDMRASLGAVLLYLGYGINTTDPPQIAEARDFLIQRGGNITAFAPDTGQILLDEGEVDLTFEWNGDIFQVMEENPALRYLIPEEGTIGFVDNLCITKDAPHPELAHKFINYVLEPEVGAQISNYIKFATPNAAALPLINEEDLNNPAIYPSDETLKKIQFLIDVGEATTYYDEAWTEIKVALGE